MMKWLCVVALVCFCGTAEAALSGKLDLGSPPQGYLFRDARNGQWRGGYSKGIFDVLLNGNEIFYLGYNQTWNAEHGNGALGLGIGKRVTIGQVGSFFLPGVDAPGWAQYVGHVLSVEGNGAYMPVHSKDVNGPFIYGLGFQVDLSDIFGILQKGL